MAKIFGKHDSKRWVQNAPRTIGYAEQPVRKPDRIPVPPAPEDLFNMAIEAIKKQSLLAVEELENSGQYNNGWKHALEEVMYSGAFSEPQQKVLHEVFSEVAHHVAIAHAKVLTTLIVCGVEGRSDEPKLANSSGSIVSGGFGSVNTKNEGVAITPYYNATNQAPWK